MPLPHEIMPKDIRVRTQPFVVVGCIIEYGGKYLLVQEGSHAGEAHKKWNQPAGWLDLEEKIPEGAVREAMEETGLDVELKGLLGVYSLVKLRDEKPQHAVKFVFLCKAVTTEPKFDGDEILDARWFSADEIKALGDQLRDADIIQEVEDAAAGRVFPVEAVERYRNLIHPTV